MERIEARPHSDSEAEAVIAELDQAKARNTSPGPNSPARNPAETEITTTPDGHAMVPLVKESGLRKTCNRKPPPAENTRTKEGNHVLLPAIVPLPGIPLSNAIEMLQHWKYELERVRQSSAEESLASYQRWAPLASEVLGSTFGLVELESLIATRRHDTLLQLHAGDSHALINGLISAELTDRMRAFDALLQSLKDLDARCNALPKSYSSSVLVPDTNVMLHQDEPFDELDWKALVPTSDEVRIVIPMVVIRELDRHKRTPANNIVSRNNKEAVRDRARRTSRELGVLFARPMDVVTLHPRAVTMELLLDPLGHVPAGEPDRELIERASALKGVTDRNVAIVTSDNGMKFAAAVADIDVISTNN